MGHCSYLNTCYSEPTYAQSPSIPAYPGSTSSRGPVSLPSGLGAGGRGKEKAPCRYLHYEVDWDPTDAENEKTKERVAVKGKPHRLEIGLGPPGREATPVRSLFPSIFTVVPFNLILYGIASAAMDQLRSAQV